MRLHKFVRESGGRLGLITPCRSVRVRARSCRRRKALAVPDGELVLLNPAFHTQERARRSTDRPALLVRMGRQSPTARGETAPSLAPPIPTVAP